ncbi:MarR family winged helix-turn-helix transcriptional regulator [Nocardia sp. BMG51109]|uniref:MarR family winged helix-turn-helix transcriptional regulator n=1 Tax=Nocardia sp. BMG51109 TaxID=1056816 RepID=UPI0004AEDDD5|nr:MarR family transcriptional regulator [Nocardia sp. BMG51109]
MGDGTSDLTTAVMTVHREAAALYAEVARRFELTSQQTQLLCLLDRRHPSFGELATLLGCDKTNVTGVVDRLQRRGLLAREPDAHDRRIIRIVPTPEGVALRARVRAALTERIADRFPALVAADPDRFAALAALLGG